MPESSPNAPDAEISAVGRSTRINIRPIANPKPMGFIALAVATLLLSALQLNWLPTAEQDSVALALLAFAFPLQFLGCVLGFLGRDIVVGTGMAMLSGTWLTTALVNLNSPSGSETSPTLGVLLLAVAVALLIPATGAALGKLVAAAILLLASVRFALTAVHELTGSETWATIAGVSGLVLCALAVYAALALLVEDLRKQTVLPVLRHGAGRLSMHGNFEDQLRSIEREAGVREQL